MTADPPPFERHHRTAQALVSTFQEALEPQFTAKGALSREEFTRAMGLMMAHWPAVLPLFASICQSCTAGSCGGCGNGCGTGGEEPPQIEAGGRRRDFVTRLMVSALRASLPDRMDPITGASFPQVIVPGLQSTLTALFYEKEWEAMNASVIALFNRLGTDRDAEVWNRLAHEETLAVLADTPFIRVMLRFRQFHQQRQTFIRRMTDQLRDRHFVFAEEHFQALFDALFGRLRDGLRTELGRARTDIQYGEGTAEALLRIFDQFDKHRQEQSMPVRVLGGRQMPRPMLAQRSMLGSTPAAKRR
ncbi:hypothetical protein TSH100_20795 [Azospirillum sp. TSH100]|uniref:hypothetical protein n=1 Tax=Azospirillum sp. TSH100 TaxID=652764 RepID=UPI000D6077E6|nr:hypothetical protein [Azospirillum sp. TSH100]PWC83445.1 hypothetical protein TSH100_20795 [Azospirillum sp. TSH100]QCG87290.1 hypothetical protein E6C72_05825 [Azospirillum sp. TSH100]